MNRIDSLHAMVLAASLLVGCTQRSDEHGEFRQVPINSHDWAVYQWTLADDGVVHWGSVVVRGAEADAIPGTRYDEGLETWSHQGRAATAAPDRFTLRLAVVGNAEDRAVRAAVAETQASQTEIGSMASVPTWSEGAAPDESATMFTLTACEGPAACEDGLLRWSLQFADPMGALPSIYGDDDALWSLLSAEQSELELVEGDTIVMTPVSAGDEGYPAMTWFTVEP